MNRPSPTQIGSVILVVGLAGPARAAAADWTPSLSIVLHVSDDLSISPSVVTRAKDEMSRIYRQAGVKVMWADTTAAAIGPDARPSRTISNAELTLILLSRELTDQLTVASTALGATPSTREYRGRIAYVFYNRVERIARAYLTPLRGRAKHNGDIDNVIVLAHAMAHEIGHLLLPYGHSATGLMRADWDAKDMRLAVHGRLNFTGEQAELIRTRLLAPLAETQSLER